MKNLALEADESLHNEDQPWEWDDLDAVYHYRGEDDWYWEEMSTEFEAELRGELSGSVFPNDDLPF